MRGRPARRFLGWTSLVVTLAAVLVMSPASSARTTSVERLCVRAFPSANQTHHKRTTLYNRQASVQAVSCNRFGFDATFHVDGGIVCALVSAAIGTQYRHLALYVDGSCAGSTLAAHHDVGSESAVACGMLSDLLGAAPWARAYATAAGVSCAFGPAFGGWIESLSEQHAAEAVIRSGRCLKFTTHSFPLTDDWAATRCRRGDRGFATLPPARVRQGSTRVVQISPVDAGYRPRPGLVVVDSGVADSCGAGSDSAGNTYRCFSSHGVYDPCWTDDADPAAPAVLCQLQPWDTQVRRFGLAQGGLEPFLSAPTSSVHTSPWGVQLTTGERCIALQGAHDAFDGGRRIVDYACGRTYRQVLLRGIARGHGAWTIRRASYDARHRRYRLGPSVRIATAWYAVPDGGDAAKAAANRCDASALAYAAQAYETAHGDPDGPLPEITAHACEAGYAIVVFTQSAPPEYEASIAFQATSAGWAFVGISDYIAPGDFGIPESVGADIDAAIASKPDAERVSF